MSDQSEAKDLLESIHLPTLLSKLAALHLLPDNASRFVRIATAIKTALIYGDTEGARIPTADDVKKVLYLKIVEGVQSLEDPIYEPIIGTIPFWFKSYSVFSGNTEGSAFILERVSIALMRLAETNKREISLLVTEVWPLLALMDNVIMSAGLTRSSCPIPDYDPSIIVPNEEELVRLSELFRFSPDSFLERIGIPIDSKQIAWAITDHAELSQLSASSDGHDPEGFYPPLCVVRNEAIVLEPTEITIMVVRHILRRIEELGFEIEFSREYHLANRETLTNHLEYLLDLECIAWHDDAINVSIGDFASDVDKMIRIYLVTAAPDVGIDPLKPLELEGIILQDAYDHASEEEAQMQHIVVLEGVGRTIVLPVPFKTIIATVRDLITFCFIEHSKLGLWYFLKDVDSFTPEINPFSGFLDVFFHYRRSGYEFGPFEEEQAPTFVTFGIGEGGLLRAEAQAKSDPHFVHTPDNQPAYMVGMHDTNTQALYGDVASGGHGELRYLTEFFPGPLWVIFQSESSETTVRHTGMLMCEMVSSWFWHLRQQIKTLMSRFGQEGLVIQLLLPESKIDLMAPTPEFPASVFWKDGVVNVKFNPGILTALTQYDNSIELTIISTIIDALGEEIHNRTGIGSITQTSAQIIDESNQQGLLTAKFVSVFPSDSMPGSRTSSIPSTSGLKASERAKRIVEQEIASLLRKEGYIAKSYEGNEANKLLNLVVKRLFERLHTFLARFDCHETLRLLLNNHEATLRWRLESELALPSRAKTFEREQITWKQIQDSLYSLPIRLLTNRFLIELTVAHAPNGISDPSLEELDALLALSEALCQIGSVSDVLHYKLADVEIEILKTGRLTVNRNAYSEAFSIFGDLFKDAEISKHDVHIKNLYKRFNQLPDENKRPTPFPDDPMNASLVAEFGFGVDRLVDFFVELASNKADDNGLVDIEFNLLVNQLSSSLGLDSAGVIKLVNTFSLKHRTDFFDSSPYSGLHHVFPWRFNRGLSTVRRPIMQVATKSAVRLLWTQAHLSQSIENFFFLADQGRLPENTSSAMRSYRGTVSESVGDRFEQRVEEFFMSKARFLAKKKFKGWKDSPVPYGDIDVLLIDRVNRTIWLLECKSFILTKTPADVSREMDQLFPNDGKTVEYKITKRIEWAMNNRVRLLEFIGEDPSVECTIEGLLITDGGRMVERLNPSNLKIMSIEAFATSIDA